VPLLCIFFFSSLCIAFLAQCIFLLPPWHCLTTCLLWQPNSRYSSVTTIKKWMSTFPWTPCPWVQISMLYESMIPLPLDGLVSTCVPALFCWHSTSNPPSFFFGRKTITVYFQGFVSFSVLYGVVKKLSIILMLPPPHPFLLFFWAEITFLLPGPWASFLKVQLTEETFMTSIFPLNVLSPSIPFLFIVLF